MGQQHREVGEAPVPNGASGASGFTLSRHAATRASQRGYRATDLALVAEFGTSTPDGALLLRRDVEQIRCEVTRLLARLDRLVGTAVILREETLVSVFRVTRAQRRRMVRVVA